MNFNEINRMRFLAGLPVKDVKKLTESRRVNLRESEELGDYYNDAAEFFGMIEDGWLDKEIESADGMEVKGYIDGMLVMKWRYDSPEKKGGWGMYDDYGLGGSLSHDAQEHGGTEVKYEGPDGKLTQGLTSLGMENLADGTGWEIMYYPERTFREFAPMYVWETPDGGKFLIYRGNTDTDVMDIETNELWGADKNYILQSPGVAKVLGGVSEARDWQVRATPKD